MKPFDRAFGWAFLVTTTALGGASAYRFSVAQWQMPDGWAPRSVLVAARDLSESIRLVPGDLVEVEVPEQFLTASSVVPADRSLLLGEELGEAVLKGDPIVWSMFADPNRDAPLDACFKEIIGEVTAETGARARTADRLAAAFFARDRR